MTGAATGGGSHPSGQGPTTDSGRRPDLHVRAGTGHHDDDVTTVIRREGGSWDGSPVLSVGSDIVKDVVGTAAEPMPEGSPPSAEQPLVPDVMETIAAGGDADDDASPDALTPGVPAPDDEVAPDLAAERVVLLDLLIYAWDRARSVGVWERLTAGLTRIGVEVIRPDGEIFDPTCQEVGGVEKTTDPALHNTIAETESAGFRDRGRLIREPVVVVYRVS